MNIVQVLLFIIIVAVITIAVVFWINNKRTPSTIGVIDGKLSSCPSTPNCVSSQSDSSEHFIEPLSVAGTEHPMETVKSIILSIPKSEIVEESDGYIHAIFRSDLFSFIDDAEFYYDKNHGVIHVRSAARVGYSDLGVNRKRVELMRHQLEQSH